MASSVGRILAFVALVTAPAHAWQVHLGGHGTEDSAEAVRFDRDRNLVVIGQTEVSGDCWQLTVASFTPRGALRWQMRYARECFRPSGFLVQDDGDVLVGGYQQGDEDSTQDAVLLQLDGATGAIHWEHTLEQLDRPDNGGLSIEGVEPDGTVRVQSREVDGYDVGDDVVTFAYFDLRLDGETGAERSRIEVATPVPPVQELQRAAGGVVRRRRADGSVAWEQPIAGFEHPVALVQILRTDEAGDVYVGGSLSGAAGMFRDFAVVKLDGDDGHELWRDVRPYGMARAVAFRRGHAYVVGHLSLDGTPYRNGFVVTRLQGDTGLERWTTMLRGSGGSGRGIAIDPRGKVVVVGSALPPSDDPFAEEYGFSVARLSSRTGRTERRVLRYPPSE